MRIQVVVALIVNWFVLFEIVIGKTEWGSSLSIRYWSIYFPHQLIDCIVQQRVSLSFRWFHCSRNSEFLPTWTSIKPSSFRWFIYWLDRMSIQTTLVLLYVTFDMSHIICFISKLPIIRFVPQTYLKWQKQSKRFWSFVLVEIQKWISLKMHRSYEFHQY